MSVRECAGCGMMSADGTVLHRKLWHRDLCEECLKDWNNTLFEEVVEEAQESLPPWEMWDP